MPRNHGEARCRVCRAPFTRRGANQRTCTSEACKRTARAAQLAAWRARSLVVVERNYRKPRSDTCMMGYSDEQLAFLRALQVAKLVGTGRPDWPAVLAVLRSLGYRRTAPPDPAYAGLAVRIL